MKVCNKVGKYFFFFFFKVSFKEAQRVTAAAEEQLLLSPSPVPPLCSCCGHLQGGRALLGWLPTHCCNAPWPAPGPLQQIWAGGCGGSGHLPHPVPVVSAGQPWPRWQCWMVTERSCLVFNWSQVSQMLP